ncbi:MAG: polyprenyl synthetase family protein [Candidatus Omnitrophota bacterium]|nr:polyprenyl synthetase family protein [Candidatus Omnitrophota bacterium]
MDIEKYILDKKKIIDKALDKYLPLSRLKPQVIHKAMRYSIFPGGKRIRPIFTIAGFEACGGKGDSIIPTACGIELIHSYTLIHDDLPCMDNDDFRRGKHTCHKKFGEDIALLAGDGLLTLAFQVIAESDNIHVIKEISKAIGTCGVIGGQVADISGEKKDIEYINLKKTAMLFEAAVKSGGIIKEASRSEINALGNFGRDIGLVFQLMDDIKDKDGYAKLYGQERAIKKARVLAEKAKSHLKIFGKKADKLLELADIVCPLFHKSSHTRFVK